MTATLETLLAIDERLAAAGAPRVFAEGSYWHTQAANFYGGPAPEWWAQVGRAGAKSTVLYRFAVNETVFGDWLVPPGERHWATVKSRSKEEAGKALGIIAHDLGVLGVRHDVAGDCIELAELPRGIRITAASVGGTSGWRSYFDGNDELAKWPRDGATAVDAREVIASGRAMTATHSARGARRLYFSTPFGMEGPHFDHVAEGTTAAQFVSVAASWVANPDVITEEETRRLEPDTRIWSREYAAIPQAGVLAAFDPDLVSAAFDNPVTVSHEPCDRVLLLDPTAGAADTYAYAFVRWSLDPAGERHLLEFTYVAGVANAAKRGLRSEDMVAMLAKEARARDVAVIHADQFERFALASAFANRGFRYVAHTWTAPAKERAVERVRRWLADGVLSLPNHEALRRELLAFEERIAPSGALTFRGRQGSHDDFAMLVMLAALVDIEGGLPGSPLFESVRAARAAQRAQRHEVLRIMAGDVSHAEFAAARRRAARQTFDDLAEARKNTLQNPEWVAAQARIWDEHLKRGDHT